MIILRQKEFNSKRQKALRRAYDYTVGRKRLQGIDPGGAESAFFYGKAVFPGEEVKRVYREGLGWHYKTTMRPGVSPEKAKKLEEAAQNLRKQNPKKFNFNQGLVAGRSELQSVRGYSKDLSNLNQRINARQLGDTTIKEDLARLKSEKYSNLNQRINARQLGDTTIKEDLARLKSEKYLPKTAKLKKIKQAGKVMAGTAIAAGTIYGAKKLYDKKN